jgi:predicted ATPase/DNA-binding XRE family transcriptional regulator
MAKLGSDFRRLQQIGSYRWCERLHVTAGNRLLGIASTRGDELSLRAMKEPTFGELLREFRVAAGISQEELAERARLSSGAISTLERSVRRAPQHQTLGLLAEGLRLDAAGRAQLEAAAMLGRRRGARARPDDGSNGKSIPENVPKVLTSFRGRDAELERLDGLLMTRRIVTLLGSGGVGKTRLALEAARKQLDTATFADGIWFLEFAPLGSAQLLTTALARVLNVREQPDVPLIETLVTAIAAKRMLFIFDNCEHLIEECARIAERLTQDCPNIVVVATTREALQIDGECVLCIEPLRCESDATSGPARDVLIDRLTEADFNRFRDLTADDLAQIATICRRLDGIPLALELAAGRARDLSLAAIADGLAERFGLLSRGRRTAVPRQQTLRGMIDWSFALLTPAEQQLFALLGLFAEGFSPEAAAAICGGNISDVRDALGALIAKSLVSVVTSGGVLRYRLLETMRAYALDRLRESGEFDRSAHRFAAYFCSVAKASDVRYGRIPNREFLALVEPELDNFRAALDWTLGSRNDTVLGADLASALGWTYRQCALFAEGARWCDRALLENDGSLDNLVAGRLHMALSFFHFNMGEMQRALDDAVRAEQHYGDAGADSEWSWALTQEAYCLYLLGQHEEMRRAAEEAVRLARGQTDPLRLATALNAFALTIPLERAADRIAALEEAIRAYRAAGDESAMVPSANLAETHYATGNAASALACGLEVVGMARRNLDRPNLSAALTNVAAYALTAGDVAQADAAAREALYLVRDLGKTMNAMCALQHLGTVHARRGDPIGAARLLGMASRLYDEFGLEREFTEQSLYDHTIDVLRRSLEDNELQEHVRQGALLPLGEALDEALADRAPARRDERASIRFDDTLRGSRMASRRR